MKQFGRYPKQVGYLYCGILEENDIPAHVIDTSNIFSELTSFGTAMVDLLIEEGDFLKAAEIIESYEREASRRAETITREFKERIKNLILWVILLGVIGVLVSCLFQ